MKPKRQPTRNEMLLVAQSQGGLLIPISGGELSRMEYAAVEEFVRQQFVEFYRDIDIPYHRLINNWEIIKGRFDQCVIDGGKGMVSELGVLQQRLYDTFSAVEAFVNRRNPSLGARENLGTQRRHTFDRLGGYHRLVNGEAGAHGDLLKLAEDAPNAVQFTEFREGINFGGHPVGMQPHTRLIVDTMRPMLSQSAQGREIDLVGYGRNVAKSIKLFAKAEKRSLGETEQRAIHWIEDKSDSKLKSELKRLLRRACVPALGIN